jgi:hypothetical protein
MPLTDGLAALEGPRWLALLNGGSGQRLPRDPTGREFRRVAAYASARMGRRPDSESTHFSGSWEWCWMAGRWWRTRRCRAKTRNGTPCRAAGIGRGGRCRNHGGMCTGPKTKAGRARSVKAGREGLLRWWARWTPETRSKYMSAVSQRQVGKMRRIMAAERARQRGW